MAALFRRLLLVSSWLFMGFVFVSVYVARGLLATVAAVLVFVAVQLVLSLRVVDRLLNGGRAGGDDGSV